MTALTGKARKAEPDAPAAADHAAAELLAAHGVTPGLNGWDSKDAASAYEVRGGALGWHRPVKDGGAVWTPLATFDAEITEESIRDDGAEQSLTWTVRGSYHRRACRGGDRPSRPARQAAAVGRQGSRGLGAGYAGPVGRRSPARRGAVPLRLGQPQGHLHPHGLAADRRPLGAPDQLRALGAAGLDEAITVDLGPLSGYALPDVPDVRAVREAVQESLALMELAPDMITVPWLAATYRAPLPLPPDCGVWIYGPSGTFKTEQTALGQQHYGPVMHAKNLPGNWTSSANDLEVTAFMLDGVLFVVDDYSPDVTKTGRGETGRRSRPADPRLCEPQRPGAAAPRRHPPPGQAAARPGSHLRGGHTARRHVDARPYFRRQGHAWRCQHRRADLGAEAPGPRDLRGGDGRVCPVARGPLRR